MTVDLFDQLLNSVCSIWKKGPPNVVDGYGIQQQVFTLLQSGVACYIEPTTGKEVATDVAFGLQTHIFYMRPPSVDDPPIPLNIHHWLQINSVRDMDGDVIYASDPDPNGTMYDIKNIKNPGLLGHHLEVETQLIEP